MNGQIPETRKQVPLSQDDNRTVAVIRTICDSTTALQVATACRVLVDNASGEQLIAAFGEV